MEFLIVAVLTVSIVTVTTILTFKNQETTVKKKLLEEFEYHVEHGGGVSTLVSDAWGSEADKYFEAWNTVLANGEIESKEHSASLQRTLTGLELKVR